MRQAAHTALWSESSPPVNRARAESGRANVQSAVRVEMVRLSAGSIPRSSSQSSRNPRLPPSGRGLRRVRMGFSGTAR